MQFNTKLILGFVLASAVGIGAAISLVIGTLSTVPDFTLLRSKVLVPLEMGDKRIVKREIGPKAPGWVRTKEISNHALMAVIASEDTSFFSHEGVDYHEL